jgi:hypothetical protein
MERRSFLKTMTVAAGVSMAANALPDPWTSLRGLTPPGSPLHAIVRPLKQGQGRQNCKGS